DLRTLMYRFAFYLIAFLSCGRLEAAFKTGEIVVSTIGKFTDAYRYSPSGIFIERLGNESGAGGVFDAAGNFYLTTFDNLRLLRFDNATVDPPPFLMALNGTQV